MNRWEFNVLVVDVAANFQPNMEKMWRDKGPDNLSNWDRLQQMGQEGWELVSTFPLTATGGTTKVVWTFKRALPPG
jgi:hypothetical protein